MSEIKTKLIEKIKDSADEELLKELYAVISLSENEDVIELSPEQKAKIKQSENAVNKGNYSTDQEIEKNLDQWLKE